MFPDVALDTVLVAARSRIGAHRRIDGHEDARVSSDQIRVDHHPVASPAHELADDRRSTLEDARLERIPVLPRPLLWRVEERF